MRKWWLFRSAARLNRFDEFFRRDVDAEVDHFESGAFEHRGDEVFPDVVHVALDRSDDDATDFLDARANHHRIQEPHRDLRRFRRHQEFRNEIFPFVEEAADFVHRRNDASVQNFVGGQSGVDQRLRRVGGGGDVAFDDRFVKFGSSRFAHFL